MASIDRQTNIFSGGPDPPNYDDGCPSMGHLCYKRLTEQGHQILLVDAVTAEMVNALQLRDRSLQLARRLYALGVRPGDAVGISALNRLEFVYVLFGSYMCGATVAPMNVTYTENEVLHAVYLSRPKIIFAGPDTRALIDKVLVRTNFIKQAITFGDEYDRFVAQNAASDFRIEPQNTADNVALIMCSSGTTGLPKGVQLTQRNVMIGIADHVNCRVNLERTVAPDAIILSIVPWFHAYGCLTLTCSMLNRERIVFLPKFEEKSFLKAISDHQVNTLYLVPPLMVFLAKHPIIDQYDLSSLRVIWCGAAPLSKESQDAVEQRHGIRVIRQGYGMTEATLAISGQTDDHHSLGSVGILRAGLQGRVVDIDSGENQPAFRNGEIWVKGSVVMKGYVHNAKATRETVDEDGWLHTGDIGHYNECGELFVVDRIKELIKYNGFQVPPAELEGVLLQHPGIAEAGVVGVPDELTGELPLAFVVKQAGAVLSERDVMDFVAERVSSPKRLRGGVIFVASIPKNPSGKILRRELRQMLKQVQPKL